MRGTLVKCGILAVMFIANSEVLSWILLAVLTGMALWSLAKKVTDDD